VGGRLLGKPLRVNLGLLERLIPEDGVHVVGAAKTLSELQVYTASADQERLAREAMKRIR